MKSNQILAIFLLVAAVLFIGFNSVLVVQEDEMAVITEFGKPKTTYYKAGLYFKKPFVQKTLFFDKRIQKWDGRPYEIPTKDKKFIILDTAARWRINNPLLFLRRMKNFYQANMILDDLFNGATRDFINQNNLVEVIRSSDWKVGQEVSEQGARQEAVLLGRDKIIQLIRDRVKEVAAAYGIDVLEVLIKKINYTENVRKTVYSRMISERKRMAAQSRSEGEALKASVLGSMGKTLSTIESQAYKEEQEIKGQADADAANIYGKAYNQDVEFYKFFITLKSYKTILGANTRLVLRANSPLYKYFKQTH